EGLGEAHHMDESVKGHQERKRSFHKGLQSNAGASARVTPDAPGLQLWVPMVGGGAEFSALGVNSLAPPAQSLHGRSRGGASGVAALSLRAGTPMRVLAALHQPLEDDDAARSLLRDGTVVNVRPARLAD